MKKLSVFLIVGMVLALAASVTAQVDDLEAALSFLVLKDYNGKPVRNASVVLHPVNKKGKQERGGIELKADADGKCYFDGIPYGKLRIQVLATGFQTFGQDYEIDQPKLTITVRMLRPQGQYSVYTDPQNDVKKDAPPPDSNSKQK
jgi:uncharacterized GH25 family protein